jgi:benzodiazapine receptor
MNLIEWILLFTPMITGFVTSMIWKVGPSAGANVPARPHPIVFGIVWPILYILMGIAWIKLRKDNGISNDILFGIITLLLCLWIVIYYYNKKGGLYVILLCYLAVLLAIIHNSKNKNSLLIVPLLVWLIFATMLNFTEVNQLK